MPSQLIKSITKGFLQPFTTFSLPIRLRSIEKEVEPTMIPTPVLAPPDSSTDEGIMKPTWLDVHANFEAEYGLDFGNLITRQKYKEMYEEFWYGKDPSNRLEVVSKEGAKAEIPMTSPSPASNKKRARESDATEIDVEEEQFVVEQSPQKKQKVSIDDESDSFEEDEDLFDAKDPFYGPDDSLDEDAMPSDEDNYKDEDQDEDEEDDSNVHSLL